MRLIFITGTDTGVGKTLLTALLLSHLRQTGCRALALKPFCSGTRADAELLHALQAGDLSLDEINPFYFSEPVAPLVAARKHRRKISLQEVLLHIQSIASSISPSIHHSITPSLHHPTLLIEGSGGLLVPLGENYSVLDLIVALECETIVVARNRLGTINHTMLTFRALEHALAASRKAPFSRQNQARTQRGPLSAHASPPAPQHLRFVLMDSDQPDHSATANRKILSQFLAPFSVHALPFLGANCMTPPLIKGCAARLRHTLALL